jgi:hypothetical protein
MIALSDDVRDEFRRQRQVQFIVGFTSNVIMQGNLARREGQALVDAARERILELFPGREETYEILYARRFARLLDDFTRPDPPRADVIPFPRPRG